MKSQDEIDIFVSCYHSSRTNVEERIRGCKCLSSAFFFTIAARRINFYLSIFVALCPPCYLLKLHSSTYIISIYISTIQCTVKAPKDNALWDRVSHVRELVYNFI
jgi:hypothetical protein